jgi:hypothetical protein
VAATAIVLWSLAGAGLLIFGPGELGSIRLLDLGLAWWVAFLGPGPLLLALLCRPRGPRPGGPGSAP